MAYVLRAVIGRRRPVVEVADAIGGRPVRLVDQLGIIPLPYGHFESWGPDDPAPLQGSDSLPLQLVEALLFASRAGPICFVEAEFFGGSGEQRAVVFEREEMIWIPLGGHASRLNRTPISEALSRLGIEPPAGADEFTAAGLGRHRSIEGWTSEPGLSDPDFGPLDTAY